MLGSVIELHTPADSGITVDGQFSPLSRLKLDWEKAESDCSNIIQIGDRVQLQLVRREGRLAMRVRDAESDLIKGFQGKHWFSIDPKFRVQATFRPYPEPREVSIRNIKGAQIETKFVGTVEFHLDGKTYSLEALSETPETLFIIFKDKTCGKATYAAGRFLDVPLAAAGQQLTLDFNLAYQPPCAFSPHTLCPLPPSQNHLDIAIEAGERMKAVD